MGLLPWALADGASHTADDNESNMFFFCINLIRIKNYVILVAIKRKIINEFYAQTVIQIYA